MLLEKFLSVISYFQERPCQRGHLKKLLQRERVFQGLLRARTLGMG